MFSKSCQYAIKATIYVGKKSMEGVRVSLSDIAEETDSPKAFTAKILQELSKKKILDSVKGPFGGFEIKQENMKTIMLREIVLAIDGDGIYVDCGLGLKKCSEESPCPIHHKYKEIRATTVEMLNELSIYDMLIKVERGESVLKLRE